MRRDFPLYAHSGLKNSEPVGQVSLVRFICNSVASELGAKRLGNQANL